MGRLLREMKTKTPLWAYLIALPIQLAFLPLGILLILNVLVRGLLQGEPFRVVRIVAWILRDSRQPGGEIDETT